MQKSQIRWIALTAAGTALFVVLSLGLQVPVFENYYLCLGYVAMAVYCFSFGTLSGTLTGFLGVILYCVVTGGLRGMPGWALGNIVIGAALGLCFSLTKKMKPVPALLIDITVVILSCAAGILGIKSLTECLLYTQPFAVRAVKNLSAFIADAAVLILSMPLCRLLEKPIRKIKIRKEA